MDPHTLALPFEFLLSFSGITTETLLRMIAIYSVVGPKRLMVFLANAAEVYCETAIFIGLEYKEVIERYQKQLELKPDDHKTRLELGRLYLKCGRHSEAVRELNLVARDPATRARATHESAIARYRAGRFPEAAESGIAAMAANPRNERARAAIWLAARSAGGYPKNVPAAYRMELKTGYEPARVQFENIAAKTGLDKICAGRGTAVFDYNNDGFLDIVITAAHAGCTLYRNNGDGILSPMSR
ncbi:MAG: tetratricopeptide repeat protein [Bryobacteraceae bacterium]